MIISEISGKELFRYDCSNTKECVEQARNDGADLQGTNLQGTNLQGADLRGANLRGANLDGAKK